MDARLPAVAVKLLGEREESQQDENRGRLLPPSVCETTTAVFCLGLPKTHCGGAEAAKVVWSIGKVRMGRVWPAEGDKAQGILLLPVTIRGRMERI